MTMDGLFLPAGIKLLNLFIPFAILLFFGLILVGIYIWTEDSLIPTILALLYLAFANIPIVPLEIRQSMLPAYGTPLLYVLVALAITGLIVNLFIRNRGY
ncbi:hypothetical protein [Geoglobus ahangari]